MIRPNLSDRQACSLLFVLLSCAVAFSANVSTPVTDNFHDGEFVGFLWQMRDYYAGLAKFPLLVHGGMDYLPSLIAFYLFGTDSLIVGTRIVLLLISALQYYFFLDICYSFVKDGKRDIFWILLIVAWFFYTTPQSNSDVIVASTFPLRDLFLTLTIWCIVKYTNAHDRLSAQIYLFACSVSSVLAIFWCYNRGIMALAFLSVFALGLILNKKSSHIATMLLSALLTIAALEFTKLFGTTRENLKNILYWINNQADINYLRINFGHLDGLIGLLILCFFTLSATVLCICARKMIASDHAWFKFTIPGLLFVQFLYLKVTFGVPILEYSLNGGWPSMVIMLYFGSRLFNIKTNLPLLAITATDDYQDDGNKPIRNTFYLALVFLLIFIVTCQHNVALPYAKFAKNLVAPVTNDKILSSDIKELSEIIKQTHDTCYFNWDNDGVIAFLANKKFCTDYPYVHYAAHNQEQSMLKQLADASPSLVVVGSDFWPFSRYKEQMSTRFPQVSQYIDKNYPDKFSVGRYLVARKTGERLQ